MKAVAVSPETFSLFVLIILVKIINSESLSSRFSSSNTEVWMMHWFYSSMDGLLHITDLPVKGPGTEEVNI